MVNISRHLCINPQDQCVKINGLLKVLMGSTRNRGLQAFRNLVINGATSMSDSELQTLCDKGKLALAKMPVSFDYDAVIGTLKGGSFSKVGMGLTPDDFKVLNRMCIVAGALPGVPHCIVYRGEMHIPRKYTLPEVGQHLHFPFPFSVSTNPEVAVDFATPPHVYPGDIYVVYVFVLPEGYKTVFDVNCRFKETGMGLYRELRPMPCIAEVFKVDKDVMLPSTANNGAGHVGSVVYCNVMHSDLNVIWGSSHQVILTVLPPDAPAVQEHFLKQAGDTVNVLPMMRKGVYVFNPAQRPARFKWSNQDWPTNMAWTT
jgi:hypothetical protein